MGLFTGFGGWINQNIQQPLMPESKRPENVKSVSRKDTNIQEPWYWDPDEDPKKARHNADVGSLPLFAVDPKYINLAEAKRQVDVWDVQNKRHPWNDAPAKIKVKTEKGLYKLKIEYTLGVYPPVVEEMLTNPRNLPLFRTSDNNQTRLENKSTKVLKKDGPRQITEVKKNLRLNIFGCNVDIPLHLIIDENHQTLTAKYKKEKMMYMKVFEGRWKVEPLYVDQERLCKSRSQISEKEYINCSNGKGRIASKVTMEHIFQPSSFLNVPPVSRIIRGIAIKTTKDLLKDFREYVQMFNEGPNPM